MVSRLSRRTMLTGAAAVGAAAVTAAVVPAFAEADADTEVAVRLPLIGPVAAPGVHVMSFNVRVAVDGGARSWESRLKTIKRLLDAERPVLLGTQEGRLHQIGDLRDALPGYGCVRAGREKDGSGETCAIFYHKKRMKLLDSGHLWLSDTPNKPGSITWGNKFPRMLTWAKFTDLSTKKDVVHINTHFDHVSENSRRRSAKLIRDRVSKHEAPCVITGDFNTGTGSVAHQTLTAGPMHDAWTSADKRVTRSFGTANGWNPKPKPDGRRIDWILGTGAVDVKKVGINTWVPDSGHPASDHWAIQAVVTVG